MTSLDQIKSLINPGQAEAPTLGADKLPQNLFFNFFKNILLPLIGVLAILVIIYGGVLYITAGPNEEQAAKAKRTLMYGIIGLILVAASFLIYNQTIHIFD